MRLYSALRPLSPDGAAGDPSLTKSNYARFWELRGRRVFEMNGVIWGHHKGPFFTCFPLQLRIDADRAEVADVLRRSGVRGLRFPSIHRPGMPGGMYVLNPEGYSLRTVSQKQRSHVTRGLDACEIRLLDPQELLAKGMELNRDTLARQSRADADFLDPAKWAQLVQAVAGTPGMSIHGAFVKGRLATYLISCREGDWLHLIYKMSRTEDREHYPNHALDFSIIQDAEKDPEIRFISNGCVSTLPNEGLDRYKRQLGYQIEEQNLCIHFHPMLASLLGSRTTSSIMSAMQALLPRNERLAYGARILEGAVLSNAPQENLN